MLRRLNLELDFPEELLTALREEDLASKAKEALVMELLREHRISQGKAAELLSISRAALFPLMTKYQVPAIDLSEEELDQEIDKPFPRA